MTTSSDLNDMMFHPLHWDLRGLLDAYKNRHQPRVRNAKGDYQIAKKLAIVK